MTLKEIILLNVHPDSDSVVERPDSDSVVEMPDSDSDSVQKSDRVHSPGLVTFVPCVRHAGQCKVTH